MILEDRLVRDLPEKSEIEINDYFVIEDVDGTKLGSAASLRNLIMKNLVFNNIEDMKMAKLNAGDYCMTLGYHTYGDGGGAIYKIVYEPTALDDKANWHYLYTSDTNRARFIPYSGIVTPEQFGAYGDGSRDDADAINKCFATKHKVVFSSGKTYRISKEITIRNGINVDLNGCTIKPSSCRAFIVEATETDNIDNVIIRNGKIDMSAATSMAAFSINKIIGSLTLENISVFGGYGSVIKSTVATRLTIHNCSFKSTSVKSVAIRIEKPSLGTVSDIQITIDKVFFSNYIRAVSLADITATMNIAISNCTMDNTAGNATTTFLHNTRSYATTYERFICITNVQTKNVDCIFDNQANDSIIIKDITLREAKMLFKATNSLGSINIEGAILLLGASLTDTTPIFYNGGGDIFLNTNNIKWNSGRHHIKDAGYSNFNGCTLVDSTPINVHTEVNAVISSGVVPVSFFRNGIIRITNSGSITGMSGGVNNQIIGLRSAASVTISTGAAITLLGATSKTLSNTDILYLKYNSSTAKWVEI